MVVSAHSNRGRCRVDNIATGIVNLSRAMNAMVASGMLRGCYAAEFENDVCVCTRCTGNLLTTSRVASRTSDSDRPAQ
eukprot:2108958-Prymnesium_polylepis.1